MNKRARTIIMLFCLWTLPILLVVASDAAAQSNTMPAAQCAPFATGGTVTAIIQDGRGYCVHTFISSANFVVQAAGGLNVDYLVVAGGGGGGGTNQGNRNGGGGGGGGFRTGTGFAVTAQTYPITVGAGGAGGIINNAPPGSPGGNSVFSTITAAGGGGGGHGNNGQAAAGGSGGGNGRQQNGPGGAGNTPSTSPSQGNNGGIGASILTNDAADGGGGGGGASDVGANGASTSGGAGGAGRSSNISGAEVTYAGGGGGGRGLGSGGAGGAGGGGAGASTAASGQAGTATRGGGGGGASGTNFIGGAGGSGIVIVRYEVPLQTIWFVPETVILNQPFAVFVEFRVGDELFSCDGPVTLSASGGNLTGTLTGTANSGKVSFNNLAFGALGSYTLDVSVLEATPSPSITVTSNYLGGSGRGDITQTAPNQGFIPIFTWAGGTVGNERDWFTFANWTGSENLISASPDGSPDSQIIIPGTSQASDQPVLSPDDPQPSLDIRGSLTLKETATLTIEPGPLFQISDGATVTTEGSGATQGRIILESGARYLNLSNQTPLLEVQRQLTGVRGWRMIASPVATDYGDFTSAIVTQGFPNANLPEANPGNPVTFTPNFLWWDESDGGTTLQGWRTLNYDESGAQNTLLSNITVPAGRGHFYFNFDGAGRPDNNGNYTDTLPLIMNVTGIEPNIPDSLNQAFTFNNLTFTERNSGNQNEGPNGNFIDRIEADRGWNLVGNPTVSALDWTAASGWTKTNIGNAIYVWDPSVGDYLVSNGINGTLPDNRIAPFQAFWVQAFDENPLLRFTNAVKTTESAEFFKRGESDKKMVSANYELHTSDKQDKNTHDVPPPPPGTLPTLPLSHSISMQLHATGMTANSWIMLSDEGNKGRDRWDAFRLEPLSDTWISASTSMNMGGPSLVINSLPSDLEKNIILPFYPGAMRNGLPYNGDYELKWELPEDWPAYLNVYLMDHQTSQMIDMRLQYTYSFGHEPELNMLPTHNGSNPFSTGESQQVPFSNEPGSTVSLTETRSALTTQVQPQGRSERTTGLRTAHSHQRQLRGHSGNESANRTNGITNHPVVVFGLPGNIAFRGHLEQGGGTTETGLPGTGNAGNNGFNEANDRNMPIRTDNHTTAADLHNRGGSGISGGSFNNGGNGNSGTQALPRFTIIIGPDQEDSYLPIEPMLMQNYPNPFNPGTTIRFALPNDADVVLEVFDILGRRVATLINGSITSGTHEVYWDASRNASGVYLYRFISNNKVITRKMTLIK